MSVQMSNRRPRVASKRTSRRAAVQRQWIVPFVDCIQASLDASRLGQNVWLNPPDFRRIADLAESVRTPCEVLMCGSLIAELGVKFLESIHRIRSANDICPCMDGVRISLLRYCSSGARYSRWLDPWAREAVAALWRCHPLTAAERLADAIRATPTNPPTIACVAQECGCTRVRSVPIAKVPKRHLARDRRLAWAAPELAAVIRTS